MCPYTPFDLTLLGIEEFADVAYRGLSTSTGVRPSVGYSIFPLISGFPWWVTSVITRIVAIRDVRINITLAINAASASSERRRKNRIFLRPTRH